MLFFTKNRIQVLSSPSVGLLDLGGDQARTLVESDVRFLTPLFAKVRVLDALAPTCDVLFLYVRLTADGEVLGSDRGLREIIRDCGAKVVIVASTNPVEHYIKAGKQKPYGQANLVMTLDRRGDAFPRFFTALFSKMKAGLAMPSAWVESNPQVPGLEQFNCPGTIFACEIGPLSFR